MQRLGQYFLTKTSAIESLLDALQLAGGDHVIEIGPGKGALTFPLAKRCKDTSCTLTAVERDPRLAASLRQKLSHEEHVTLLDGDIRSLLPTLSHELIAYKLIGNIPYYLTGQLLRILGELIHSPLLTVLTIQKQVAERLAATPPRMNILAASVQVWADVEIILTIPSSFFSPPPKVASAAVRLIPHARTPHGILTQYYVFIRIAFKQPRKTLLNNLLEGFSSVSRAEVLGRLAAHGFNQHTRPQELSFPQLVTLSGKFRA